MAFNFNSIVFNDVIATGSTNYDNPSSTTMSSGIEPNTDINSRLVNSFLYKCSAAIKQIQENGAINYIPGKVYNEGNIVTCNVLLNNNVTIYLFRCKNDNVNEAPLSNMVMNDDNGYIYFTGININENWDRIFTYNDREDLSIINEFQVYGSDVRDTDYMYFSLYDKDLLVNKQNAKSEYRLIIKRDDYLLNAYLRVSYANSKISVNVNNIFCDNYSLDSSTSIWNDQSTFKDFALLGCMLTLKDNQLNLVICPRRGGQDVSNKKIYIKLEQITGNIFMRLENLNNTGTVLDNSILKIPFINGASSDYKKSMLIFDSFEELDYSEKYKRGLLSLDQTAQNNMMVYSYQYLNEGRIGIQLSDFTDNYTATIQGQDYEPVNEIYKNKLDAITDIKAQFKGTIITADPFSMFTNAFAGGLYTPNSTGLWDQSIIEELKLNNFIFEPDSTNGSVLFTVTSGSGGYNIEFNASYSNDKYSNDINDKFYMKSTKVFKYIYFI